MCGADPLGHLVHPPHQEIAHCQRERADRTGQFCRPGNYVARGPGVKAAHGDHGRLCRVDAARDDALPRDHNLAGDVNGIDSFMGHGAVPALAGDDKVDFVGAGPQRTGLHDDLVERQPAPQMQAEGSLRNRGGERAVGDHRQRTAQSFLRWLKDELDAPRQRVAMTRQQLRHAHADGGVAVVSARVHHPRRLRTVREVVFFLARELFLLHISAPTRTY